MDGRKQRNWLLREGGAQNRKAGKIDRNFDDFAVNLNADEIPISWTEKGLLRVGGSGEGGWRTGVLFSVDKFDDGIE